jgi:2-deoxy-scyllo-inosamine dehydrogenase (SAM-dependent)
MADEVFIRLHEELRAFRYAGRISYHFLSEPLLRKDLPRLIALSKSMLPASWQVLFTNGDFLTDDKYNELVTAGVDQIVITQHDGIALKARERQIVQFPQHLLLTNRGGTLAALPAPTREIKTLPCYAPTEMFIVTSNGDVLLCYEDSKREHVFGNIMLSSLQQIWSEPGFVELRRLLREGRRTEAGGICEHCSNAVHAEPGRSARSEPFWTDPSARV